MPVPPAEPPLCRPRPARLPGAGGWVLAAALLAWTGPALAQPATRPPLTLGAEGQETQVLADRIQELPGGLVIAEGGVEITRGGTRLVADRVELNRDTGEAVAQGRVVFFDGQDRLVGERVDYNLRTGTGVIYDASAFSAPYYRLSGERLERLGEGVYSVRRGIFTTCEGDPPAWSFHVGSGTVELDEVVWGRDASFWVGHVPVLPWVPFFAAALRRERQSGFLFPELGQSSRRGAFVKIPYFWAISDSQDLTLRLDAFSKRGVGLDAEYRYILSRDAQGAASAFGIHEAFRDRRSARDLDENRGHAAVRHDWQVTPSLALKISAAVTSDDLIYRDYGDRLSERAQQRAESNVFLTQRWESWNLVGNVKWYQDLTTGRPIELQRVPDLRLHGLRQPVPGAGWLLYETEASATRFIRDVGPDGARVDLHPRVYLPLPVGGLFTLTPFLGGRVTFYDRRVVGERVTRQGGLLVEESVRDDRVRRQVEAGVEAETRASRVYVLEGAGGLQALQHVIEPRITLTEIRGLDQKAFPQYDPGARTATGVDPGYDRRTGIDRVGKANEVTYSLTNRLNAKAPAGPGQEAMRWELARLVLSQTYNFNPVDEPFKDLYGDLVVQPTGYLRLHADARHNVNGLGLREANADISAVFRDVQVMVGPRFNEQAGLRFLRAEAAVRATRNVDLRGITYWDVTAGTAIENRAGIDWWFDCWAVGLEFINRRAGDDEIRFSLNLLGLGQTGTRVGTGSR